MYKTWCKSVDCIQLALWQDPVVTSAEILTFAFHGSKKSWDQLSDISLPRRIQLHELGVNSCVCAVY